MKLPQIPASTSWPENPYQDAVQDLLADRFDRSARRAVAGMLEEEGPRLVPFEGRRCVPEWLRRALLQAHYRTPKAQRLVPSGTAPFSSRGVCALLAAWWRRHCRKVEEDLHIDPFPPDDPELDTNPVGYPLQQEFSHCGTVWAAGNRECFVHEPVEIMNRLEPQAKWIEELIWPSGFALVLPVGARGAETTPRMIVLPLQPSATRGGYGPPGKKRKRGG